jgi:hypothetical protein
MARALDRVLFARALSVDPDPWQRDLLRSSSDRVLLNCCRQSGKSTMTAVIGLHRAIYYPGSLILCLAPALRQSQELFAKVLTFYRDLGRPVPAHGERKLTLELENGSRIVTLPGMDKTIRGFNGATLLIVDEAARGGRRALLRRLPHTVLGRRPGLLLCLLLLLLLRRLLCLLALLLLQASVLSLLAPAASTAAYLGPSL